MNSRDIAPKLFALLCISYLAFLFGTAYLLPDEVASHFDVNGRPNGWLSRSGYLTFMALMGLGLPLFIVAICYFCRSLPVSMVNIPNREYWLAPERQKQTLEYLFYHSFWLGSLMVCFLGALHFTVLRANRVFPAQLPPVPFFLVVSLFLIGVTVWIVLLYRRFSVPR